MLPMLRVIIPLWMLILSYLSIQSASFCLSPPNAGLVHHTLYSKYSNDDGEALEALRSLSDFHEGTWNGQARSFTVTPDVAAGIVQRKTTPLPYTVSVKFGVDSAKRDFTLTETMQWNDNHISSRTVSLSDSNMDVDAVDASFSLDTTLPDFPAAIAGTDKLKQFMIEHCIATGNNRRDRCLAFYGTDQNLIRVVVCEETRVLDENESVVSFSINDGTETQQQPKQQLSAQDLIEMEGDVDRLVDKIVGRIQGGNGLDDSSRANRLNNAMEKREEEEKSNQLVPHPISLLELSSGIWLGDAIIRDIPMVPVISPLQQQQRRRKGFGQSSSSSPVTSTATTKREKVPFGAWSVGVQKVARRWMWNFGAEIRQVNEFGKAMGAEMSAALTKDLGGNVCLNEGLSRRIPPDERMVYIDWNESNVGFLIGSHSIQLPRYLNFDRSAQVRPFCTEFCVYQRANSVTQGDKLIDEESMSLPELVCSKIERVYNYEGSLKQGCTSFFQFKRFGNEGEEI